GEVQAFLYDTTVKTTGALDLTATGDQSISAVVVAASAGIGGSSAIGVAASGAGVSTQNSVASLVRAYMDGDGTTKYDVCANEVSVAAEGSSRLRADARAGSLAFSFAGAGAVSISIGVSLAQNVVDDEVQAFIRNADKVTSNGDILLTANELDNSNGLKASYNAATDGTVGLVVGDTVSANGSTYRYVGQDYNYTTASGKVTLQPGDTVRLVGGYAGGGMAGALYAYSPTSSNALTMPVDL